MPSEQPDMPPQPPRNEIRRAVIADPPIFETSLLIAPVQQKIIEEVRNNTEDNPDTKPITLAWVKIKNQTNQLMLLTEDSYQRLNGDNLAFRFGEHSLDPRYRATCQTVMYMWNEALQYGKNYYALDPNKKLLELDAMQEYKRPRFLEKYLKAYAQLILTNAENDRNFEHDRLNDMKFAKENLLDLHHQFQEYLQHNPDVARSVEDRAIMEAITLGEDIFQQVGVYFGEELVWNNEFNLLFNSFTKIQDHHDDNMWQWRHHRLDIPSANRSDIYLDEKGKLLLLPLPDHLPSIPPAFEPTAMLKDILQSGSWIKISNSTTVETFTPSVLSSSIQYELQKRDRAYALVPTNIGQSAPTILLHYNDKSALETFTFEFRNGLEGGGEHIRRVKLDTTGNLFSDSHFVTVANTHGLVIDQNTIPQTIGFEYDTKYDAGSDIFHGHISLFINGHEREFFHISPTSTHQIDLIAQYNPFYVPLTHVGLVSQFCDVAFGKPAADVTRRIDYQDMQFRSKVINAILLKRVGTVNVEENERDTSLLGKINFYLKNKGLQPYTESADEEIITNQYVLDDAHALSDSLTHLKQEQVLRHGKISPLDDVVITYTLPPDCQFTNDFGIGQIEIYYTPSQEMWRINVRSVGTLSTQYDVIVWNGATTKGKLRTSHPFLAKKILYTISDPNLHKDWKSDAVLNKSHLNIPKDIMKLEKDRRNGNIITQSEMDAIYHAHQEHRKNSTFPLQF